MKSMSKQVDMVSSESESESDEDFDPNASDDSDFEGDRSESDSDSEAEEGESEGEQGGKENPDGKWTKEVQNLSSDEGEGVVMDMGEDESDLEEEEDEFEACSGDELDILRADLTEQESQAMANAGGTRKRKSEQSKYSPSTKRASSA